MRHILQVVRSPLRSRLIHGSVWRLKDDKDTQSINPALEKTYEVDMSEFPRELVRNFGIIAHVDHGKSTLSDRLLEYTGTISRSSDNKQVLDKLQVERERGITVKAQSASMIHEKDGKRYLLNLIDTPGHVDFSYEVRRSLVACQGVILLIDANQGIQAQTVANFNLAFCSELHILPVLNKIDLKGAKVEESCNQIESLFGYTPDEVLKVSAKAGTGIPELVNAIIEKIPPPEGDVESPFRALLVDSWFDTYRGVIVLIVVKDGSLRVGDEFVSHKTKQSYTVREIGLMFPGETPVKELFAGQSGYLIASLRASSEAHVGDTLHSKAIDHKSLVSLPAVQRSNPMVFAGIYPEDQSKNSELRSAIERLVLNDNSVKVNLESNPALGQGWRLGFLGLLHMDVFCQRLDQEFDAQVVVTAPSVTYKVKIKGAKNIKLHGTDTISVNNPLMLPDVSIVEEYFEPMVEGSIITPAEYLNAVIGLCVSRRGVQKEVRNIDQNTALVQFKFPLNEVIVNFFDELKSISSGYASFDYEETGYEPSSLCKLQIAVNDKICDELTQIVHSSRAQKVGRSVILKLKETIPQQIYAVALQAKVGAKVLAREDIKALSKNVTQKIKSGSDQTRKQKLLKAYREKQKNSRMVGNIQIPKEAFMKVLGAPK